MFPPGVEFALAGKAAIQLASFTSLSASRPLTPSNSRSLALVELFHYISFQITLRLFNKSWQKVLRVSRLLSHASNRHRKYRSSNGGQF